VSLPVLISCRVAVVFAIQSWLAESPEQKRTSSTPAYFQVGMSGESLHLESVNSANYIKSCPSLLYAVFLPITLDRRLTVCTELLFAAPPAPARQFRNGNWDRSSRRCTAIVIHRVVQPTSGVEESRPCVSIL